MTRRILLLAVALAALVLVLPVGPAEAHEGDGTIEVITAEPANPLEITYRIRLTYQADGHPAVDATVTVVAERPDGTATTPQPMTPAGEEGVYDATVRFPAPGAWTVRFTAVTPAATAERAEAVAPPATTTSTTTTTSAPTSTTVRASPEDPNSDGDSGPPVLPLAAGGVAVAAVAGVLVARRRR